jgi:quercetin dioxygenase-like cupin family protein
VDIFFRFAATNQKEELMRNRNAEMKLLTATIMSFFLLVLVSANANPVAALELNTLTVASGKDSQTIKVMRSGSQPSINGPAENFSGTVRIDRLFLPTSQSRMSGSRVTFETGARTAWHAHPLGQTLIVTDGTGWVQQWGGKIEEIQTGDVVRIPPGQKHWHGATATTSMTHISIVEQIEGKSADWMEKVSGEQYHR